MEEDDDEHRLNIDNSREQNITLFDNDEQSSDDEQVRKKNQSEFIPTCYSTERGRTFSKE